MPRIPGTGVMSPTYSYRRKRFLLATSALIVIGTALTYLPGTTFSSDPTRLEDFSYFNDGIGRDTKRRTLRHVGVNHVVDFLAVRHPQIQILEQNQDNNAYYDSARERRDGEGDDVYDDDVDEKEVNARRLELRSRNRSIKEPIIAAQGQILSSAGVPIVNDYIYWSQEVMDLVPKGLTSLDVRDFRLRVRHGVVGHMATATWNKCGRPKNQFATLTDGTELCARYRKPHKKLILGEVLSFYLSRLLGLDNVPVVTLSEVNASRSQWAQVDFNTTGWHQGTVVALIQWIDELHNARSRVRMPPIAYDAHRYSRPLGLSTRSISTLTSSTLISLVQWSDMVVFDYITGHYDRVASMQDAAHRDQKPTILLESIRNLRQSWRTRKHWLIDNESGLFDAYELLYFSKKTAKLFRQFHTEMLQTFCIFRPSLVHKLRALESNKKPHEFLLKFAISQEPLINRITNNTSDQLFKTFYAKRLTEVVRWFDQCKKMATKT